MSFYINHARLNLLISASSILLLTACSTSRNETSSVNTDCSAGRTSISRAGLLRLDSVTSQFRFSVDSIAIIIPRQDTATAPQPVLVTMHGVKASRERNATTSLIRTTATDSSMHSAATLRHHTFSASAKKPSSITGHIVKIALAFASLLLLIALFRRFMKKIE